MNEMDVKRLPSGAHFFKCALQVNPFDYLIAHDKPSSFTNESEYNAALIEACREQKIDAIVFLTCYEKYIYYMLAVVGEGKEESYGNPYPTDYHPSCGW